MILSLQEPCLERQLMTPGSPRGTGKRTIHAKPQDAVMKDRLFSPGQGDLLRGMRFLGRYGSMGLFNLGHNRSAQLPFFETKSWRRVLDPCGDTVERCSTWGCSTEATDHSPEGSIGPEHHTSSSTGHTTIF